LVISKRSNNSKTKNHKKGNFVQKYLSEITIKKRSFFSEFFPRKVNSIKDNGIKGKTYKSRKKRYNSTNKKYKNSKKKIEANNKNLFFCHKFKDYILRFYKFIYNFAKVNL
jgi:hypothetical protein